MSGPATLPRRTAGLAAWIAERHGAPLLLPIALVYGVAVAAGSAASAAPAPAAASVAVGAVSAWLWFLTLRILDDLGDRDEDDRTHPERLLQQGVVTSAQLRGLAALALLTQLAGCVLIDGGLGPVSAAWAITVAATTAVIGLDATAPLRARPIAARLLRTCCSALPLLWWAQLGAGDQRLPAPTAAALLAFGLLLALTLDVARKSGDDAGVWTTALGRRGTRRLLTGAALGAIAALGAVVLTTGGSA